MPCLRIFLGRGSPTCNSLGTTSLNSTSKGWITSGTLCDIGTFLGTKKRLVVVFEHVGLLDYFIGVRINFVLLL